MENQCMLDKERLQNLETNLNVDEKGLSKILYMDGKGLGKNIEYGTERVRQLKKKIDNKGLHTISNMDGKGLKNIKYGLEMVQKGLSNLKINIDKKGLKQL